MNILNINSSSNKEDSTSSSYAQQIVEKLVNLNPGAVVVERHATYSDLPFINEEILGALFVKGEKTDEQKEALAISDKLVDELRTADTIVLSAPIYNFSVPASLKAYFDLVARAGLTFQYTENGSEGLLKGKKAYVVISSGGTEINSEIDFAGILESKRARPALQRIIHKLKNAEHHIWSPVIMNNNGFGILTNHSLIMASYISRANAAIIDLRILLMQG